METISGKKRFNIGRETSSIDRIPPTLIKSLNVLGLSNYEARVYAALVLFDGAEAKEIVDFLSLSKPSVYEALEDLAVRGLVIKQNSKPARYRTISPEIALDLLMGEHQKASERALSVLEALEKEKVRSDMEDVLWTIYGDANIEYKIHELFNKAKTHISCIMGDRYVQFLDNVTVSRIPLRLIIFSGSPGLEEKMRKKFRGKHAEIHIVPLERVNSPPPVFAIPEFAEAWKFLKFENVLELNVDDDELLMSPAFFSGMIGSVLNTRNKGAIIHMKMFSQLYWKLILEGYQCQHSPHSHQKSQKNQ